MDAGAPDRSRVSCANAGGGLLCDSDRRAMNILVMRAETQEQAYLAIKYHPDNRNRGEIERLSAVIGRCGLLPVCVTRHVEHWGAIALEPQELMLKTFALIDSCVVVIVVLNEKGVGLGIEAGYARAKSIPIVVLISNGKEVPTTMRGICDVVIEYADEASSAVLMEDTFRRLSIIKKG
jgi:2'-deoxynucleoside 5'-phosphate N-hydrolase